MLQKGREVGHFRRRGQCIGHPVLCKGHELVTRFASSKPDHTMWVETLEHSKVFTKVDYGA